MQIISFDTWEEYEFVKKHFDVSPKVFKLKNGQHDWEWLEVCEAYDPIDVKDFLSSNYSFFESPEEYFENTFSLEELDEENDKPLIEKLISCKEKYSNKEYWKNFSNGDVIVVREGTEYYPEIYSNNVLRFHDDDVTAYKIGFSKIDIDDILRDEDNELKTYEEFVNFVKSSK